MRPLAVVFILWTSIKRLHNDWCFSFTRGEKKKSLVKTHIKKKKKTRVGVRAASIFTAAGGEKVVKLTLQTARTETGRKEAK